MPSRRSRPKPSRSVLQQAQIDGLTFSYRVSGGREPVVTIHGALIADAFMPLFPEPSLADYRLIAYRRRDYSGSSPASASLSLAEQAADCHALLGALGVARAHVVGHSFGGCVALQLALDAPEVVQSLVLLEPALAVGDSAEPYRASLQEAMRQFREGGPDATPAVHAMMEARWPGYRQPLDAILPGAFEMAVDDAHAAFITELPGLIEWRFEAADAARISQPVLSVIGEESPALSPRFAEAHQWILDNFPSTEAYVLPRAHHFLQIENPGDMASALAAFWSRHPIAS